MAWFAFVVNISLYVMVLRRRLFAIAALQTACWVITLAQFTQYFFFPADYVESWAFFDRIGIAIYGGMAIALLSHRTLRLSCIPYLAIYCLSIYEYNRAEAGLPANALYELRETLAFILPIFLLLRVCWMHDKPRRRPDPVASASRWTSPAG